MSITAFSFGEWLPDLPDLGNPGLTEALNVLPVDGSYVPFLQLSPIASATLPAKALGALYPLTASTVLTATITNVADGIVGSQPRRTITTSGAHGFNVGDTIVITGVVATGTFQVNGTWQILTVPSGTTFLVQGSGDPSGAYSSGGTASRGYISALVAGTESDLYAYESSAWTKRSLSTYTAATSWDFATIDTKILATNNKNVPQVQTAPGINFADLATAGSCPVSATIGVVGRFAVVGNTTDGEYAIQWSALDDVRNWPTPNSATAIATQSGRQYLSSELGSVQSIHGADQIGIILQRSGVVRMTYAGPPVVFQFDTVSKTHGAAYKHSGIMVNGLVYFASAEGFYVTDGVNVIPFGERKTDRYFLDNVNAGYADFIRAAHDKTRKLIYWSFPDLTATSSQPNQVIAYNYSEKRWAHASQVCDLIFTPAATETELEPWGFDSTHCLARFNGSAGIATLQSGEVEPQPGGCALINGIKPVIASSGTAPSISVQVGSRDDQATSVSYSSTTVPTSRTGFADFRSDARYHRARVYITGNFDKAQGLEIDATPTGGM